MISTQPHNPKTTVHSLRETPEMLFARLLEQAVQVDLCRLLGQVDTLHPGVVGDVLERRPV